MAKRDNFTTILLVGAVGVAVFAFTRRSRGLEEGGGLFGGVGGLFGGLGELAAGGGELLGGAGEVLGTGGDILETGANIITEFVEEAGPGLTGAASGLGGFVGGVGEFIGGVGGGVGDILSGTGEFFEETGGFIGGGIGNIPERLAAGSRTIFRFFSRTAITSLKLKGLRIQAKKAEEARQAREAAAAQRRLEIEAGIARAAGRRPRSIRFRGFRIPVDSTGLPVHPGLRTSFLSVGSGL